MTIPRKYVVALAVALAFSMAAHAQYGEPYCVVSPFSNVPAAIRMPIVTPWSTEAMGGAIYVGHTNFAEHFVEGHVDGAVIGDGNIITSFCSRLLPGANLEKLRKQLRAGGEENADHLKWAWTLAIFDKNTGAETNVVTYWLDDHGDQLAYTGSAIPSLPAAGHFKPGDIGYHQDVYDFFVRYQRDQAARIRKLRKQAGYKD